MNTIPSSKEIHAKANSSFKWNALGEGATRLSQPLLLLVLSRFLTPTDFGLVAVAIAVNGILQVWQDFGLGKTLIQSENDLDDRANVVFWVNLSISALSYLGAYIFARSIADGFRAPEATTIIRMMTLRVVISGATSVQQGILQRNLDFRTLFFGRALASIVPVVISIPMAFMDYGVWSIVTGALIGSMTQSGFLWARSSWRPSLQFNYRIAADLFQFSKWIFIEGLLASAVNWGDSFVVAHYLGQTQLGVYQLTMSLVRAAYGLLLSSTAPVAYALFIRLRNDPRQLQTSLAKTTNFLLIVTSLGVVFVHVIAQPGIVWLLGPKWIGAETILAILVLILISDSAVSCIPSLLTAVGLPQINVWALSLIGLISFPSYIYFAKLGLTAFAYGRVFLVIIDNILIFLLAAKVVKLEWSDFGRKLVIPMLCAAVSIIAIDLLKLTWQPKSIPQVGAVGGLAVMIFLAGIWTIDKTALVQAWKHLQSVVGLEPPKLL